MYLSFRDVGIILIKTLFIALLFVCIFNLVEVNIHIAEYICQITNIPKDLSLTIVSAGFANNIVIVLLMLEVGLILYIINKISKISFVSSFLEKINNY